MAAFDPVCDDGRRPTTVAVRESRGAADSVPLDGHASDGRSDSFLVGLDRSRDGLDRDAPVGGELLSARPSRRLHPSPGRACVFVVNGAQHKEPGWPIRCGRGVLSCLVSVVCCGIGSSSRMREPQDFMRRSGARNGTGVVERVPARAVFSGTVGRTTDESSPEWAAAGAGGPRVAESSVHRAATIMRTAWPRSPRPPPGTPATTARSRSRAGSCPKCCCSTATAPTWWALASVPQCVSNDMRHRARGGLRITGVV